MANNDFFDRVRTIFVQVCNLSDTEQAAFLQKLGDDEPQVREEIESLLEHYRLKGVTGATRPWKGPPAPEVETLPDRIGPYRIIHQLGRGGMGVVYLGMLESDFRRRAAVKVLKRGMDTEALLKRFEDERQILAGLDHPNIAHLYDGGATEDGRPYFAMEYIEGLPIDKYCDHHGLSVAKRIVLFQDVCKAVHYAHQKLVIHRDIKPDNVLVTADGTAKLVDFGIAKLVDPDLLMASRDPTEPERRVMTPEYASPEHVLGYPMTTSSDVYSLGVLLYELVTGHSPYRITERVREEIVRIVCKELPLRPSTRITEVEEVEEFDEHAGGMTTRTIHPDEVAAHRGTAPERLQRRVRGDLDNIILMAMRKEPLNRYASAEQFAADLDRHRKQMPVIARPASWRYRAGKFVRRNKAGVAAVVVVGVTLVAGLVGTTWGWTTAEQQRRIADRRFDQVRDFARVFMTNIHDGVQQLDGSLPVQKEIVDTSLSFLDELHREGVDRPDLRSYLADNYDHVGDIHYTHRNKSLGDMDVAMKCFETARELRAPLLGEPNPDPHVRAQAAANHVRVGDILYRRGDFERARAEYDQAVRLLEALTDEDRAYRDRLSKARLDIGRILAETGEHERALERYEDELATQREITAERVGDLGAQRQLSVAVLRVAGRMSKMDRHEEALPFNQEAVRIRRSIFDLNPTGRGRRDLYVARMLLGQAYLSLEEADPAGAIKVLDLALAAARETFEKNPDATRPPRDLSLIQRVRASALAADDRRTEAVAAQWESLTLIRPTVSAAPQDVALRVDLADALRELAALQERREESRASLREAIEHYEAVLLVSPDHHNGAAGLEDAKRMLGGSTDP